MNRPAKVQSVLDGVRDLLPTFRERADEGERLRVVPESSVKELEETGFFRLLQPKRYGGFEADPVDFYTAVRDIASADGSTRSRRGWSCSPPMPTSSPARAGRLSTIRPPPGRSRAPAEGRGRVRGRPSKCLHIMFE